MEKVKNFFKGKSNFKKVVDFNTQFGVLGSNHQFVPNKTVLIDDPRTIEFCMKLVREEIGELEESIRDKDYTEVVDALLDSIYVLYGMLARIGVDADKFFDIVHKNNMSKMCKTEKEARDTVDKYIENASFSNKYDSPLFRKTPDGKHYVVYNDSTKKILKSIKWKPLDLNKHL